MKLLELSHTMHDHIVTLDDKDYTVIEYGSGSTPVLTLGIGSLLQKSLSPTFHSKFNLISTDLYWANHAHTLDINQLTIEQICLDIMEVAKQVGLERYILMGHSVFGGLAIEAAKYQDPHLMGVIGIGATPGWDNQIIQFKDNYFETHASHERKQRFMDLQRSYIENKSEEDSLVSVAAYYAESPKYFADEVSYQFIEDLWHGVDCDHDAINHLFNDLLAHQYQFAANVDSIHVPVLIAGGRMDFDSVPLEIWKHYPKPKTTSIIDCGDVGHWPHLEAPEIFDNYTLKWLRTSVKA